MSQSGDPGHCQCPRTTFRVFGVRLSFQSCAIANLGADLSASPSTTTSTEDVDSSQTLPVRLERSQSHQQSSVGLLLRPLRHPILGTRVRIADRFAWNSLQRSALSLLLAASRSYRFWKTEHLKRVESWGLKACPATLPLQTFEARLRFWLTSHRFIPCGRDLSVPPQTLFPSQTDKDVRATTILRLDLADR